MERLSCPSYASNWEIKEKKQSLANAIQSPSILATLSVYKGQGMLQTRVELMKQFCKVGMENKDSQ